MKPFIRCFIRIGERNYVYDTEFIERFSWSEFRNFLSKCDDKIFKLFKKEVKPRDEWMKNLLRAADKMDRPIKKNWFVLNEKEFEAALYRE